jgi:hypothetical protein
MDPYTYRSVHEAAAFCERTALEEWRKAHARDLDLELALSRHVRRIETTSSRSPGGNVSVTVSITCTSPLKNDVSYFPLQRAGNKCYRLPQGE